MTDFLLLPLIERFAQMLAAQPLFAQIAGIPLCQRGFSFTGVSVTPTARHS